MANFSSAARVPSTDNRERAENVARLNTRQSVVGKLVARVVEVSEGRFSVFVDCDGAPYGAAPL